MTDMSETFRARLKSNEEPPTRWMILTVGPKAGEYHPFGPYCEKAGCIDEEDA